MAPTNTNVKSTSTSNYVPPSLRNKNVNTAPLSASVPSRVVPWAKKTALKKEFAMDLQTFPALQHAKKVEYRGTPISFSSAAAKKVEAPIAAKVDVLPGWVHIRSHAGKIQYKYGEHVAPRYDNNEQIMSRIILKNRIEREQYDRDRDIDALGDLSEFYGQMTLADLYENDKPDNLDYSSESSGDSHESDFD
jgi:hypothetical protein